MFDSVSSIGAGRVARIILGGWKTAQALPETILACDTNRDAVAALQADFPSVQKTSLEEAAEPDLAGDVFATLHVAGFHLLPATDAA